MRSSSGIKPKAGAAAHTAEVRIVLERFTNIWQPNELCTVDLKRHVRLTAAVRSAAEGNQVSSHLFRPLSLRHESPVLRIAAIGNVVGYLKQGRRPLVVLKDFVVEVLQRQRGNSEGRKIPIPVVRNDVLNWVERTAS